MKARNYICLIFIFFVSCNNHKKHEARVIEPAIYYWKTIFKLSDNEKNRLQELKIKKIYLKFFDVAWDKDKVTPIAQTIIKDSAYLIAEKISIVPTIFITNESLLKTDSTQINLLAKNISNLFISIKNSNELNYSNELQIDCDWTGSTKNKYFSLLNEMKILNNTSEITATIRFHQIKFMASTGVPPVKNGMLMCYNMGNLTNFETQNSILEIAELKKYIGNLKTYPMHLDVALPIFSWNVLFRKQKFKTILTQLPTGIENNKITIKNNYRYSFLKDTTLDGIEFFTDDVIRVENISKNTITHASKIISKNLPNTALTVSLYHLDTLTLNKFTTNEIQNIYSSLQ